MYSGTPLDTSSDLAILTLKDEKVPFYKYDTMKSEFVGASAGAIQKYVDFAETDPATATQALVVVMQNKVVGVYLVNE